VIQPTRRAVVLLALGAPVALAIGVLAPGLWLAGLAWLLFVLALVGIDGALAAPREGLALQVFAPAAVSVSGQAVLEVRAAFAKRPPRWVETTLDLDPRLNLASPRASAEVRDGIGHARFEAAPTRRGSAALRAAWARWTGPLGLAGRQAKVRLDQAVDVTPDIERVKDEAIRLFSREQLHGLRTQLDAGDGAEFHALREFQPGMDIRSIDWKQSARHNALLARENRAERNHPIVLALDCGRSMCEPVAGMTRLDWALNAALLLVYVGLKMGDRAALYAFDAKPRLSSGTVVGVRAFAALQRLAARIDYSTEETNYTLGLFTLLGRLERRSLVVVFSEFSDAISAELMLESVERLLSRHLVLFVVMQDEELESLQAAEPHTPDDVSRAVIAAALLREREVVLARLRRMGVEIVEAPADRMRGELLDRYIDLKRRNRL
jgi:uncharacterized protein (DUF58 family)